MLISISCHQVFYIRYTCLGEVAALCIVKYKCSLWFTRSISCPPLHITDIHIPLINCADVRCKTYVTSSVILFQKNITLKYYKILKHLLMICFCFKFLNLWSDRDNSSFLFCHLVLGRINWQFKQKTAWKGN